jgi:hypothetical protein
VVDRKNLPDYEPLNRRARATPQNQFAEFTEKQLLYPRYQVRRSAESKILKMMSKYFEEMLVK